MQLSEARSGCGLEEENDQKGKDARSVTHEAAEMVTSEAYESIHLGSFEIVIAVIREVFKESRD